MKYTGPEKYIKIFKTIESKCDSCNSPTNKEIFVVGANVTFFESIAQNNEIKYFGSLNGHKIIDLVLDNTSRCEFES